MNDSPRPTALTIGFFDGVHRGHRVLLDRVRSAAERLGLEPAAVTFDLHSLEVLHGRGPLHTILTTDEKVAELEGAGMAFVKVFHFTPEFAAQSGQRFVEDILHAELHARYLAVGRDFRFGHNRSCGSQDMVDLAAPLGLQVEIVELVDELGAKISSREIRRLLTAGEVRAAAELLGRPYSLTGEVVEGRRLGRTIGFPTANLSPPPRKIIPARGVYVARARVGDDRYDAVLNIGVRPTVQGVGETIEAHLCEFTGDLYGETITLELIERLRDEQTFDGLAALQAQIEQDVAEGRRVLRAHRP